MNRRRLLISIIFACAVVSISPLFDSVIVTKEYDLLHHRIGFPLPIIEQQTSLTPEENVYPFELGFVNPQEHPIELLLTNFTFSILIISVSIYLVMSLVNHFLRKGKT